jgi:hypothetical protein
MSRVNWRLYQQEALEHPVGAHATWEMVLDLCSQLERANRDYQELARLHSVSESSAHWKGLEKQLKDSQRQARWLSRERAKYKELFEAAHPVPGADPTRPDPPREEESDETGDAG